MMTEPKLLNSYFSIESYDGGKEGRGYEVDNLLVCDRGSMQIHSTRTGAYSTNLVLKSKENVRATHIVLYSPHILPYACREGRIRLCKSKPDICKEKDDENVFVTTFRTPKLLPQISIKIPHDRDFKYLQIVCKDLQKLERKYSKSNPMVRVTFSRDTWEKNINNHTIEHRYESRDERNFWISALNVLKTPRVARFLS